MSITILYTEEQRKEMLESYEWISNQVNGWLKSCVKVLVEKYNADEKSIDIDFLHTGLLGKAIVQAAKDGELEFDAESYIDEQLEYFYNLIGFRKFGVDRVWYLTNIKKSV